MDIPLPDDNICSETVSYEPVDKNIGNDQIDETPVDLGEDVVTKPNERDEAKLETVVENESVANQELGKQDESKEAEEPSILDIPVPEISLQYSPSVPNEDEIVETTQDVLDISLPEGPGVGSILPSKSVVKKRLQSMLKQTAANKFKTEPIEIKLKDKEKPQEKEIKKKFGKKLSVADVQARTTISEIEEMKRKENETRDSILIMELLRKKQKEEARAARAEKEAQAKAQKARDRSEERKRRRERDRQKDAARETRRREEEDKQSTKDKKDPLKLKNWKEFNKAGYSLQTFRRKKARSAPDKEKQNKIKDKTKYNLLETPKILRSIICATGPYNNTTEYPSWCRRTTISRPTVEYCFNPAYETCHFYTREQMMATLPDDILEIVNNFLSSLKGKRLVSSVDVSKLEAPKGRCWFSKVFLDDTVVKSETEEYEIVEEDPESDIEGRWKDDIQEETKISEDGNNLMRGDTGKLEEPYSLDVGEKWKNTNFPMKEEGKYFDEPSENIADIDVEGKWKYSPLAEPQSPDIEGKWKYSPLPEPWENAPADDHASSQSEQISKFTDAEGRWKDNISLKPSLTSKSEAYRRDSPEDKLTDSSSYRNKTLSENDSKHSDFDEGRRDKSPKVHKSPFTDKTKHSDVSEEKNKVDDSRRRNEPLPESSSTIADERRKKTSPPPKHKRSSREKRKGSVEDSPRRRSRTPEKNKSFEDQRRGSSSRHRKTSSSSIDKSKESPKLKRKRSYNEMEWNKIQEEERKSEHDKKRNKNNEMESNSSGDEERINEARSRKTSSKDNTLNVNEEGHKVDTSSYEENFILNLDEVCLPSEPIDRESFTNVCDPSQETYKPDEMELDENKSPVNEESITKYDNKRRNDENTSDNFTEDSTLAHERQLVSSLKYENSLKKDSKDIQIDSGVAVKESLVSEYEEFMKMVQLDNQSKDVNSPDIKYLEHQRSNILEAIVQSYSPKNEKSKEEGEDGDDVSWSKSSSYDVKENVLTITPEKIKSKSPKKDSDKKEKLSKHELKKKKRRQSTTESSDSSDTSDSDSSSSSSTSSSSTSSSSSSDSSSSTSSSESSNSDNTDDEKGRKKKKKSSIKKKKSPKKKKKSVDIKSKELKPSKKNKRVKDKKLKNEKEKSKASGKKKVYEETKEKSVKRKKSKKNKSESEEDTPFKVDKKSKTKSKEKKDKREKKMKLKKNKDKKKSKFDEKAVNKKLKVKKKNKDKENKKEKRDKSKSGVIKSKKHKSKKRRESTESSDDEDFSDIDRFVELLSKNKTVKEILFDGGDLELPLLKKLDKEESLSDDDGGGQVPLSKDLIVNKNIINLDELEMPFPNVTEQEEDNCNSVQLPLKEDTPDDILDDVSLDVPLPEEDTSQSEIPLCKEKTSSLDTSDTNRPVSVESNIYEPSYSPDNQSEDGNLPEESNYSNKDTGFPQDCKTDFDVSVLDETSSKNKQESKVESYEMSLSEISETSLSYQIKNKFTDSVEGLEEGKSERTDIEMKGDTKKSSCSPVLKEKEVDIGEKESQRYSPGMSDDDEAEEEISCKPVNISKTSWSETENSPNFTFPKQEIEDSKGSYLSVENIPLPYAESSCTDLPRGSPIQSVISGSDTKDSNSSSAELKVKKNPSVFSPEKDSNAQHASPHSFITMKLPIARLTFEKQVVKIKQNNIFSDEDSDPESKGKKPKLDLPDKNLEVAVKDPPLPTTELHNPSVSPTKKSRWFGEEILLAEATAKTVGPSQENKDLSKSEISDNQLQIRLPGAKEDVIHESDTIKHKPVLGINLSTDKIEKPLTPMQQVSVEVGDKFKLSNDSVESLSGSKREVLFDSEKIQELGEEERLKTNKNLSEDKRKSPGRNLSPFQNRSYYSPPRQNPSRGGSKSPTRKSRSRRSPRRSPYKGRALKSPARRSPFRESSRKTGNRSSSRERSGRTRSKRSSSYDRYRKSPIRGDRFRNSPSRDKYRKSPVRERYRKSSPRDKHRNSPSKDRYLSTSSKDRYRESPIKDRLKEASSKEKYSKSPTRLSPIPEKYRKSPLRRSPFKDRPKSPPPRRSPSWRDRNPDAFTRSPDTSKSRPRRWDVSPKYSTPGKRSRTKSPEIKAKLLPFVNKPHPLETLLEVSNKPTALEGPLWNNEDPSLNTFGVAPTTKDPNNQNLISITPHKFPSSGLADSTSQSESNEADADDERRMSLDDRIRLELGVDVLSESGQKKFRYQNQESFYQSTESGQKIRGVSTSNLISLTGDWPSSPLSTKSKPTLDKSGKLPPQIGGPEMLSYQSDVLPLPQPCVPVMPSPSLLQAPPPPINALPLPMQPLHPLSLPGPPLPTDVGNTAMPFNLPPVKTRPIETPAPNIVPVVAVQYSRSTDSSQPPLPNKSDEALQPTSGGLDPLIKKYLSNLQPGSKSLPLPEISEEEQQQMSPVLLLSSPACPTPLASIPITLKKFVKDKSEAMLKRKEEKEKRRREKELRHKRKQEKLDRKLQRQRALLKEGFIKSTDLEDEEEPTSSYLQDPSYLDVKIKVLSSDLYPPAGKSILCYSGFGLEMKKSVSFADGIKPGEGESPANAQEEHRTSPVGKTGSGKKKRKVKVRIVRMGDEEGWSPPPPPPGTPPPEAYYTYCTPDGFIYSSSQPNTEILSNS